MFISFSCSNSCLCSFHYHVPIHAYVHFYYHVPIHAYVHFYYHCVIHNNHVFNLNTMIKAQ